jgi:hypothetical protein
MPLILLSVSAFSIFCNISFKPGDGAKVKLKRSIPARGFSFPLSGISTPAFRTRIEFSLIEAGLSPEATRALILASKTIKKRIEVIMIPVIVARVYLRKVFILKKGFNEMGFKYIKN